jgi:hypothetical protein
MKRSDWGRYSRAIAMHRLHKNRPHTLITGEYFNNFLPNRDGRIPLTRPNSASSPLRICKFLKNSFQSVAVTRHFQKTFFSPAELPAALKNHFSCLRSFPQLSKIVFHACGTSRSSQKSFFMPAELPAALKNRFSRLLPDRFDAVKALIIALYANFIALPAERSKK